MPSPLCSRSTAEPDAATEQRARALWQNNCQGGDVSILWIVLIVVLVLVLLGFVGRGRF